MKFPVLLFCILLTTLTFAQKAEIDFLPNFPYDKYELKSENETNTFYLSISSHKNNLPLIVFIQGSGMNSLFTIGQNGKSRSEYGHMTWFEGKAVKLELIDNADHSFNISNQPEVDGWKMIIEKIYNWFTE